MYRRTIRCDRSRDWDFHECICCRKFLILLGGPGDRYFCRLNLDPNRLKHFADLLHAQKLHIHGVKIIRREVAVELVE